MGGLVQLNERSSLISKLQSNFETRVTYIQAKVGTLVPSQIRALRLKSDTPRQPDLAREAEMHQSRISMLETAGANPTIGTLSAVAAALRVGLIVKFVPFSEMLAWENGFSQDEFKVTQIDKDALFLNPPPVETHQILPVVNYHQYNEKRILGADIWSEVITIPLYDRTLSVHSPTPNVVITTGQILDDEWSRCRWQNEINPTPQAPQSLMLTQSD